MQITVLKETDPNESRVALVPESVKKLVAMNVVVAIERGAGLAASINDSDYETAGATISGDRAALIASTDILFAVGSEVADFHRLSAVSLPVAHGPTGYQP